VTTWIGLMRAVNVSGRMLSMKDAVAVAEGVGCADVRTYLQSGNIVFSGTKATAGGLAAALSARAGFDVPVLLRSAAEMAGVVSAQPLNGPESAWHVTFLEAKPATAAVTSLDATAHGEDAFAIVGREVYLRTPSGYGRTKLNNALFERKLRVVATTRNWRTVLALVDMSGGATSRPPAR
jgi:uncharacterized protein (DUF1697 family)